MPTLRKLLVIAVLFVPGTVNAQEDTKAKSQPEVMVQDPDAHKSFLEKFKGAFVTLVSELPKPFAALKYKLESKSTPDDWFVNVRAEHTDGSPACSTSVIHSFFPDAEKAAHAAAESLEKRCEAK